MPVLELTRLTATPSASCGVNDVDTRATRFERDTFAVLLAPAIVGIRAAGVDAAGVVTEAVLFAALGSISNSFTDAVVV